MTDTEPTTELRAASTVAAHTDDAAPETTPRPRVRWAGIVWGLVFAAVATTGAALTWTPRALDDLATIVPQLTGTTLVAGALLAIGALALVTGVVGLLRHAQNAADRHRA